ncbi:MAG TPA: hypothetical protein VK465_06225 [Fibrobacteria bacterium]|nr:hypothetical protein [Fibrobacteria bacterium]
MKNLNALPTPAPRSQRAGHRAALALVLLALPAAAQVRNTEDDSSAPKPPPTETVRKLVYEKLRTTLPAYDKTVLTTYETPNAWEDNLEHRYLSSLLGETPFTWDGTMVPPAEADRLSDESKTMRIRRAEGSFRYHSRKRAFLQDYKGKPVPTAEKVTPQIQELLRRLAFPLNEGGKSEVQTQEIAVSGATGSVAERFPTYAFFQLRRHVAGLPVEGSTVRAAVNHRGEIQRLKIAWPHFKVRSSAALLAPDRVLEEAAQKILAQDPTERIALASRLVYTRSEKGDYLPAVQIDVTDGETPYRLTLPVAK